jgi:hypothetical protein
MKDERENLPSASGADRVVYCAGSVGAESKIPPSKSGKDAQHGNHVHGEVAGEEVDINEREALTATYCKEIEMAITIKWAGGRPYDEIREVRFWLTDSKLNKIFSGKPDLVLIHERRALILDFKALMGEVAVSPKNWQLRSLAVLLAAQHDLDEVTVGIIQPWVTRTPELCIYDRADLEKSEKVLLAALEAARQPNAPRKAGDHCKWCRAKKGCEQFESKYLVPLEAATLELSPAKIAEYLTKAPLAKKFFEELDEFALTAAASGVEIPGFKFVLKDPGLTAARDAFVSDYLDANDLRQANGNAKKGANATALQAWEEKMGAHIEKKSYDKRFWTDAEAATTALTGLIPEDKLRMIRGKLVKS